jgi:hypothetical protein
MGGCMSSNKPWDEDKFRKAILNACKNLHEQQNLYNISRAKEVLHKIENDDTLIEKFLAMADDEYIETIGTDIHKTPKLKSYNITAIKNLCKNDAVNWFTLDDICVENDRFVLKYYAIILTELPLEDIGMRILVFETEYEADNKSNCGFYMEATEGIYDYEYIAISPVMANKFRADWLYKIARTENEYIENIIVYQLLDDIITSIEKLRIKERYKPSFSKRIFNTEMKNLCGYINKLDLMKNLKYVHEELDDNKKMFGRKIFSMNTLSSENQNITIKKVITKFCINKKEYKNIEYWIGYENMILIFKCSSYQNKIEFEKCYIDGKFAHDL